MSTALPLPRLVSLRAIARGVGFAGLGAFTLAVGLANVLAGEPADFQNAGPPLAAPSARFALGTDQFGRDMASELLHALSVTLGHAALATVVTIAAGGILGFVAVRFPLRAGVVLRWLAGVLGALPPLFLGVLLVGIVGRGFAPEAAGLAAAPLAFLSAFDRAHGLARSRHALFARATGIPMTTLLRRDLAYEIRDHFLALAARALASVTIILATMSVFGFGASPPRRDLGLMIASARDSYFDAWWTAAFPALVLILFVLCARLAALDGGQEP
ncbi:MAG: ABC transporter permease [Rhizomicrobium sp.]